MIESEITFSVPKSALVDSRGLNTILQGVVLASPQGVSPSPEQSMLGSAAAVVLGLGANSAAPWGKLLNSLPI